MANLLRLGKKRIKSFVLRSTFRNFASKRRFYFIKEKLMEQKRTTPEFITELQPNEIFVFGSNLQGMHGGGAAYIAYRKFGAIMELRHSDHAGWGRHHPSLRRRLHPVRQGASAADIPRDAHRLRHRRLHRCRNLTPVPTGTRRREHRAARGMVRIISSK